MKKLVKNKSGFSLIEVVMVVFLIVILAGVMVLNISTYIQRAENASNDEVSRRESYMGIVSESELHLSQLGF